jgi:Ca2+-binding EF-hand superfamily protein
MGNQVTIDDLLETPKDKEKALINLFNRYDKDKNGYIDQNEFILYINEIENYIQTLIKKTEIKEHAESSKKIDMKKFEVIQYQKYILSEKKIFAKNLKNNFESNFKEKDGKIKLDEFKQKVNELIKVYEKNLKYKKTKPEEVVINKLKKSNKKSENMPYDELYEWAESLAIESELVEWYLNPDFAATEKAVKKLF